MAARIQENATLVSSVGRSAGFHPLVSDFKPTNSNLVLYSSHLENAIQSTKTQYSVDLAELEVAITAGIEKETRWKTVNDILNRIDEIEAPLYQIKEVGDRMTTFTSQFLT